MRACPARKTQESAAVPWRWSAPASPGRRQVEVVKRGEGNVEMQGRRAEPRPCRSEVRRNRSRGARSAADG
ncbi:hypothetical protein CLOM_g10780 [Closterium sp. NIES-68]|nr:hypothetical protein CLOM_g10780 [Closterium sp. NIES-68]